MLALERGAASMGAAVAIVRLDMTASALRAAASREKDGAAARRITESRILYRMLNEDISGLLRARGITDRSELAAQLCHIGQPVSGLRRRWWLCRRTAA